MPIFSVEDKFEKINPFRPSVDTSRLPPNRLMNSPRLYQRWISLLATKKRKVAWPLFFSFFLFGNSSRCYLMLRGNTTTTTTTIATTTEMNNRWWPLSIPYFQATHPEKASRGVDDQLERREAYSIQKKKYLGSDQQLTQSLTAAQSRDAYILLLVFYDLAWCASDRWGAAMGARALTILLGKRLMGGINKQNTSISFSLCLKSRHFLFFQVPLASSTPNPLCGHVRSSFDNHQMWH